MTHVRFTQSGQAHRTAYLAASLATPLNTSEARTPCRRRSGPSYVAQVPALISEPCTVRAMTTTTARPIMRVDQIG